MVLTALTLLDQREEREIVSKIFKLQTLCAKLDCGGRPNDLVHCILSIIDMILALNLILHSLLRAPLRYFYK